MIKWGVMPEDVVGLVLDQEEDEEDENGQDI